MFSICAYKESPYLEECIQSLKQQIGNPEIIICTSTPNDFIKEMAKKYNLKLFINPESNGIMEDQNFAYNCADADYVTIAHQDDKYAENYHINVLKYAKSSMSVLFTDYMPLKHGQNNKRDLNSILRRMLRYPMKFDFLAKKKFFRVLSLSFGNSICCPSCTYNKKVLGKSIFQMKLKYDLDWLMYLILAKTNYQFVYIDKPLTYYRISDEATSSEQIKNGKRFEEDLYMFSLLWPKPIAKLIMKVYPLAYKTYD